MNRPLAAQDEATSSLKANVLPREQALIEAEVELAKPRPNLPHLAILNRHIFQKEDIPYGTIPQRLRLSTDHVSYELSYF
jgi:hypothetical protein